MNGNIRIGNLFGIPFYLNLSWFLVLALVTFSYGGALAYQFPAMGLIFPWILGLVAALLLFASVLAHELGHSFVAIRQGIEVKSITLFLFGGLASLERESKTPGEAFWVAIAGPAVSLMLFILFSAVVLTAPVTGPFAAILGLLAQINLILGLFNLIPGLPLDGGNILKSLVWKITGNPYKGVIFAGRVGQALGWIAVLIGGLAILGLSPIGSFWTLLIGFFVVQNAGTAAQSASIQDTLSHYTAADAVNPNSPIVSAELSLREFANEYIIGKTQWRKFLVTDEAGYLIGSIAVDDLKLISTSDWPNTPVKELMKAVESTTTIKSNVTLLEAIAILEDRDLSELPVINDNGVLVGLLEKGEIIRKLQQQKSSQTNPA
ncbi:MAG: site-2 protease family protein [Chroococcales cyanobacterium]